MSNQEPENNSLINFIATTVETMRDQMGEMREQMGEMREQMATKDDMDSLRKDVDSLREETAYIGGQVETMRDQMATKSDIARLETKIEVEATAIRGDIEQGNLRLDSIDRAIRVRLDQLETEMSRFRSVLYLLVKDKPDMLRLLGQMPFGEEGRP
ncbi:MAG TPA: hypothetical protein VF779_20690 [Pyrinomonadaceae bacterium]